MFIMKIALIGYGKMGKTIENIALLRGHEIVLRLDVNNPEDFDKLSEADVAIEFTRPESAVGNLEKCIAAVVPVVCGTTGWLKHFDEIAAKTKAQNSGFFYASNYSIGVNIFFEINKRLAEMMNTQPQYDVKMEEIHHTQKLDAPSGTAITLAEGVFQNIERKTNWVCTTDSEQLVTASGARQEGSNPNGTTMDIAGICNAKRNVFGMMPHPERASESVLGNADGRLMFQSLIEHALVY